MLGCTCVILSPEKLIRVPIPFSLRNFIVVRSRSVQMGSSISGSLADEEMRGKTYSAKELSAATLDTVRGCTQDYVKQSYLTSCD